MSRNEVAEAELVYKALKFSSENKFVAAHVILAKPEAIRLACSGFERGLAGMEWRAGL